jgi:hypothetical protein
MPRRLATKLAIPLMLILLHAPLLPGQEAVSLQKSDIIRLLSGTTYTQAEVAGIIRQSCLSFTPTERDRSDFRALGAGQAVMGAIDGCVGAGALRLSMPRSVFQASVGGSVSVTADVREGVGPAEGVRLRLLGSGAIPGGPSGTVTAVSDARGRAVFRVPVGTRAATYNLTIDAAPRTLSGSGAVTVRAMPGAPATATAVPDPLLVDQDDVALRVEVRDRYGNVVPAAEVEARSGEAAGARVLFEGTASRSGDLSVSLSPGVLADVDRLVLRSGQTVLGSVAVQHAAPALARIVFVAGADQSADSGRELSELLVLEVRDAAGAVVAQQEVRFLATNGTVEPEVARTDAQGRAGTRVTVGTTGSETEIAATVGQLRRTVRFPITLGGMTVTELETALAEANDLLAAGNAGEARTLYERVAAADPGRVEARIGIAESHSVAGNYAAAVADYRGILRTSPSLYEAQIGMARASMAAGNAAEATRWYQIALSQNRSDVGAWVALGRARAAGGRTDDARSAYEQALALDPGNEDALRGLARLSAYPMLLEADVWGGNTFDNGRDANLRWAELRIYPAAGVRLWGGFDNALSFRHPYLVRGADDMEAGYGGVAFGWGPSRRYVTSFEFGRQEYPVDGTRFTTYSFDQAVGLSGGGSFRVGGWLGDWFDRLDYAFFVDAEIAAGSGVSVRPAVSYGNYVGTNLGDTGRTPEKEVRVSVALRYESTSGWGIEPGVAYGNVVSNTSEVDDSFDGDLFDATARLWYGITPQVAFDSFVHYQSPPGTDSFWTVAVGLRLGVRRAR